jgi:hypothetical protein
MKANLLSVIVIFVFFAAWFKKTFYAAFPQDVILETLIAVGFAAFILNLIRAKQFTKWTLVTRILWLISNLIVVVYLSNLHPFF